MTNIAKKLLKLSSTGKTVVTPADLAILWAIEDKNVLRVTISRAVKKGYLESVRRGLYKLKDREVDSFDLAGKLKKFSYISFETVLSRAGIIYQWSEEIISAAPRNSKLKNEYGEFRYRRLPEKVLLNNTGIINKGNYFLATPERALGDKIYKDGLVYLDSLSEIDANKIKKIAEIYDNKRLKKDIKKVLP